MHTLQEIRLLIFEHIFYAKEAFMIDSIAKEGTIQWTCVGDEGYCQAHLTAHVSDLEYVLPPDNEGPGGATVALPQCCGCGTRCFLKADYTMRELASLAHTVVDDQGTVRGYAMPLRHVRNLLAHHALYQLGKAQHAPVLAMPSEGLLEHPVMQQLKSTPDVAYSIWFAWALVRELGQSLPAFDQFFLNMAQPALTGPKEDTNAT
jgi:hypothetical protein